MNNPITPLSGVQTLNAAQTTPTLQSVSLSVAPGIVKTLKTVGTAFYVSACYFLDDAGNRISTAVHASMNADSAFLVESGTKLEFETFDRPFNELHFRALADKETFVDIQIAYMLRVSNSGGAGTASDLAHLQAQVSENQKNLQEARKDIDANAKAIADISPGAPDNSDHLTNDSNPHKTTLQQVLDSQTEMDVTVRGAKNIITAPVDGSFSGVLLGDFAARIVSVDAATGDMSGFASETYIEPDGKLVRNRIFGAPLELSHAATEPEHAVRKDQLDEILAASGEDILNQARKDIESGKVVFADSVDDTRKNVATTPAQLREVRDSFSFPQVRLTELLSERINAAKQASFTFPSNGLVRVDAYKCTIALNRPGAAAADIAKGDGEITQRVYFPVKKGDYASVMMYSSANKDTCFADVLLYADNLSSPYTQAEWATFYLERSTVSVEQISDTQKTLKFSNASLSGDALEWLNGEGIGATFKMTLRDATGVDAEHVCDASFSAATSQLVSFALTRTGDGTKTEVESRIELYHSGDPENVFLKLKGSFSGNTFSLDR